MPSKLCTIVVLLGNMYIFIYSLFFLLFSHCFHLYEARAHVCVCVRACMFRRNLPVEFLHKIAIFETACVTCTNTHRWIKTNRIHYFRSFPFTYISPSLRTFASSYSYYFFTLTLSITRIFNLFALSQSQWQWFCVYSMHERT